MIGESDNLSNGRQSPLLMKTGTRQIPVAIWQLGDEQPANGSNSDCQYNRKLLFLVEKF